MALSTFSNLTAAIRNWIKRDDDIADDRIKEFIIMAEARIFSQLRIRSLLTRETLTCTAGTATVALPTRWRSTKSLYCATGSGNVRLKYVSPDVMIETYWDNTTGVPQVFSYDGDNIRLAPTPGDDYELSMLFYKAPLALSATNSTNTILTNYPNLYLFASLVAAHGYLIHDERIPLWEASYQQALEEAHRESIIAQSSGSVLETRSIGATP